MNHNKTIRQLEQKLEQRDKEFATLLENFNKLKVEYEKQFYRTKELQNQVDFLSNVIQKNQTSEDENSDEEQQEDDQIEEMQIDNTTQSNKRKGSSPPISPPPNKAKTNIAPNNFTQNSNVPTPQFSPLSTQRNTNTTTKNLNQTTTTFKNVQTSQEKSLSQNEQNKGQKLTIPPIILRDTAKWNMLNTHMTTNKISYTRARQADDGIKITPTKTEDYRNIIRFLDEQHLPYHTYKLPEEKELHVVLRGIPTTFTIDEIKEDLQQLGFHPTNIFRMTMQPNRRPIPLVLVLIPKTETNIFQLTHLLHLSIKVESLKNKTRINQCRNCQKHGHGQSTCKALPKCLKCAGDHHTSTCTKSKETPAKCANCGGDHPANYSRCPQHPTMIQQRKTPPNTFTSQFTSQNISYAQITKTTPAIQTNPITPQPSTRLPQSNPQHDHDLTSAIRNIQLFANQFINLSEQLSKAFAPFLQLQTNQH